MTYSEILELAQGRAEGTVRKELTDLLVPHPAFEYVVKACEDGDLFGQLVAMNLIVES